jgi:hypothetical protein
VLSAHKSGPSASVSVARRLKRLYSAVNKNFSSFVFHSGSFDIAINYRHIEEDTFCCRRVQTFEECRLLGYSNPVRTSKETRYVSATELRQLMLCKI